MRGRFSGVMPEPVSATVIRTWPPPSVEWTVSEPPVSMVYVPLTSRSNESGTFVIRTENDPAAMADPIRKAIWSVDAQVVVPEVRTMETIVDGSLAARDFQLHLLLAFAACALVLAALGIYGVVAYSALQRTRELGIRIALGAQPAQIYRLILEDGVTPVLVGGPGSDFIGNVVYANVGVTNNIPFAAAYAILPLLVMALYLLIARKLGAFEAL